MATVIRFARHGTKKKPFYRIVVQDKTAPRNGRFIERLGSFQPVKGEGTLVLSTEKLKYWISKGAKMSDSVKSQVNKAQRSGKFTEPGKAAAKTKEA